MPQYVNQVFIIRIWCIVYGVSGQDILLNYIAKSWMDLSCEILEPAVINIDTNRDPQHLHKLLKYEYIYSALFNGQQHKESLSHIITNNIKCMLIFH